MRRAFTLVELLVTITIILILAGVSWGVLYRARETARVAQTKATVAKIHRVVTKLWEEYRIRRLPVESDAVRQLAEQSRWEPGGTPAEYARIVINIRRDLIRMEMPDRWSDVTGPPLILLPPVVSPTWGCGRRATYDARRRMALARGATQAQISTQASAELLFLIVGYGNTDAVRFHDWETGDKDGDGLREFHDAWGNPILWRRWPAGFLPDLEARDTVQRRDNPPAYDSRQLAGDGWQVYPLIFSAGPDGLYDINRGTEAGGTYAYRLDADGNLNPCQEDLHQPPLLIGQPSDSTGPLGEPANGVLDHHDNIHNHSLFGE
jgi:prepilin-type N-terminal cleavage/methylation domain-containing protein